MIDSFKGEYRFLSNFWPVQVEFEDMVFPSVEHAYVAAKTLDHTKRKQIAGLDAAGKAKAYGRFLELRPHWNDMRVNVMTNLLHQKFMNRDLLEKLLATRPHELVEGNTWGDTFWGQCPVGNGENMLGKLLMKIRDGSILKYMDA